MGRDAAHVLKTLVSLCILPQDLRTKCSIDFNHPKHSHCSGPVLSGVTRCVVVLTTDKLGSNRYYSLAFGPVLSAVLAH